MSARHLAEISTTLLLDYIQNNIEAALGKVSIDRADNLVSLEKPKSYFYYSNIKGLQLPAIIAIAEDIDFRKKEKQANFINAIIRTNVVCLVEDIDTKKLQLKAWRYQAALHEILDQAEIENSAKTVKDIIVITSARFSPTYTESDNPNDGRSIFRKEALLELEINHYEKL